MHSNFVKKSFAFFKDCKSLKSSNLCSYEYDDQTFIPISKYVTSSLSDQYSRSLEDDYLENKYKLSFLVLSAQEVLGIINLHFVDEEMIISVEASQKVKLGNLLIEFSHEIGQHSYSIHSTDLDLIEEDSLLRFHVRQADGLYRLDYLGKFKTNEDLILTAGPSISLRESSYAYDAAHNGWNAEWSKYMTRFEEKFAQFVGSKYAISTSSCTGALQIALTALDIGPGDEVIVPDVTWVATANAVRYVGATPIFCDIEIDSWNMDINSVKSLVTENTKAIMPVHMYGNPARMDQILAYANERELHIIEDAAPAIGAKYNGKSCGTFGEFGSYSFQGAKLLVTGEGGMLVTDSEELFIKAKKIWDQGRNPNKTFWIDDHGVKFKMSNVQAAIGLGQLERADELIAMKRRIFSWYENGLKDLKGLYLNKEVKGAQGIYWMSSIRLDENFKLTRDELISYLKDKKIDTRPVFPPISRYPIWEKTYKSQPNATLVGDNSINLPSGVCLSKYEVDYICEEINRAYYQ